MDKITFKNNILFLGYGAIARATIPLVNNHFDIDPTRISVLAKPGDFSESRIPFEGRCIKEILTKNNYTEVLGELLTAGDLLVNLTAEVSSLDLMRLCSEKGVLYLDTCIELWPDEISPESKTYDERELLLKLQKTLPHDGPTTLSSMGANPGIVSLLTKKLIRRMASEVFGGTVEPKDQKDWAKLTQKLGVRVIHINERDTQYSDDPVGADDFFSTWSIPAMIVESIESAEMSIGSHERLPDGAQYCGTKNIRDIYFSASGKDTMIHTWLPVAGEITAMILNHNEPYSIAELYTLEGEDGSYSPTVCFAYHPCDQAMESLKNLTVENHQDRNERLLLHDIKGGIDELGVFIMTETHGSFWLGSRLDVHTARKINPDSTATSLQVAGGVVAGMCWVATHPNKGLVEPEEVREYSYILDIAEKYWGGYVYERSNWLPEGAGSELRFEEFVA